MARVYSHQQYVTINISLEGDTNWGVDPADWGTGSRCVPFRAEDLHYETDVFPDSEEFTGLGGLTSIDLGRRVVLGSLTVEPAYNPDWFWMLFGMVWGYENLVADFNIWDDTTGVANCNTHVWSPGSATRSLAMRIFKAGAGPLDASHWYDTILGLKVTRMLWEQPAGDRARVTFDFVGKSITTAATTGLTPDTLPAGIAKLKAKDLSRTNSAIFFGGTLAALNIKGFTLEIDKRIEPADNFINDLLTLDEPDIVGTRAVTLTVDTDLETDYNATGKPWTEFLAQTTSSAVLAYESEIEIGSTGENFQIRFDLPALTWTDVRPNIRQAGVQPMTLTARAAMGPVTNLESSPSPLTAYEHDVPPGTDFDVRCLCQVDVSTDELGDNDAKYTDLPTAT